MTLVWGLDLPDSEKIVLLALADCANDEGLAWPSMASLSRKCSKSERTCQGVIKSLVTKGLLVREEISGKGCKYWVKANTPAAAAPRSKCTPAESAPPQGTTDTPAAAAPKPSRTINTSEAKASSVKRATRLPDDFVMPAGWKSWAMRERDWSDRDLREESEAFSDYWQSKPGAAARKLDWEKTWRNWVRNSRRQPERQEWGSPC